MCSEEITAKDFRTWAATNLTAAALVERTGFETPAAAKHHLVEAVEHVAKTPGNTPTICRKCYIHPTIFGGYLDGSLLEGLKLRADEMLHGDTTRLTVEKVAITGYLSRRLGEATADPVHKRLKTR